MILTSLEITPTEFEAGTGWAITPQGASNGDRCVPLPEARGDRIDVAAAAARIGMPLVADADHGLWALGPAAPERRPLLSAQAPELTLPDIEWQAVLAVLAGRTEGGAHRLGSVLRLLARPARVTGAGGRAPSPGPRDRHRRHGDRGRGRGAAVHRDGRLRASLADRRRPRPGRALRRGEHPERDLDRSHRDRGDHGGDAPPDVLAL
jgi:hypothetical protein